MKRRAELSLDIAEACERVRGVVEAVATLRAAAEATGTSSSESIKSEKDVKEEIRNDSASSSHMGMSIARLSVDDQKGQVVEELQQNCQSTNLEDEFNTRSQESGMTPTPSNGETCSLMETGLRARNGKDCDDQDPSKSDDALWQDISVLQEQAEAAIKHLRILRAQWQAGGQNFESWAGLPNRQSQWRGQAGRGSGRGGRGPGGKFLSRTEQSVSDRNTHSL